MVVDVLDGGDDAGGSAAESFNDTTLFNGLGKVLHGEDLLGDLEIAPLAGHLEHRLQREKGFETTLHH